MLFDNFSISLFLMFVNVIWHQKFCLKFFIVKAGVGKQNKNASLMLSSRETTNKDTQLKTQLLMSYADDVLKGSE